MLQLRFSAHLAILLLLQNRVSENSIKIYNKIVSKFIKEFANLD